MPTLTTPPKLLNSAQEPANGTIVTRVTNQFLVGEDLVVGAAAVGRVVDGVIKNASGSAAFVIPPTPTGYAVQIVLVLDEWKDGRPQTVASYRTVSVPDGATVTWSALVDVLPVLPVGDYAVPTWASDLLEARDAAATSAASAETARAAAVVAKNAAEAVGTTTDGLMAGVDGNAASAFRVQADARQSATFVRKGDLMLNVRDYGATGDGVTDDTAAIQAAVNAATAGRTIYFPPTGSGASYVISSQITITTPSIRILGVPRDAYAVAITCATVNVIMFMVKTTGVVFENIGLYGGGGAITGIEFWGDTDGNCDSRCIGVTFQRLLVGVRTRGRNNTIMGECLFSISTEGVVIDGPDAVYHTGAGATVSMWGNKVVGSRFHGNGSSSAQANIRITPAARVLSMQIIDNEFDGGKGAHVVATGDATYQVKNLVIQGNAHSRVGGDVYVLSRVVNSSIRGASVAGYTDGYNSGHMYTLADCVVVTIADGFGLQIGKSGIKATNCTILNIEDTSFNITGMDTGAVYHGLDIDSTNTEVHVNNVFVSSSLGWGFTGSPTGDSSMVDCTFRNNVLGRINSTTLHNRGASGRNVFIEGTDGRKQDSASKPFFLLVAGGATPVATVTAASNYTSFELEVRVIGRNSAGNIYARVIRYIRPENGTPQYTVVGTDVIAGTVTVAFTTSGTSGVGVTAAVTGSDAPVTVHVTALAGGGANSTALRGVTIAMA